MRSTGAAGFTLIEIMIAAGLLSLVFLSLGTILWQMSQVQRDTIERSAIIAIRTMITQEINKYDAWVNTYRLNANFANVLNGTVCNTAASNTFILYGRTKASGTPPTVHDAVTSAASGFTNQGRPCTTYPSKACPIRLVLTWTCLSIGSASVPTGYFPYGTFPSSYFPANFFPGLPGASGIFGTSPAQVRVTGQFSFYNYSDRRSYSGNTNYDFSMIKEVP